MVAKAEPLAMGAVFGRLTVTSPAFRKGKYLYIQVTCSCGAVKEIEQTNLRKGKVNSCGCLNKELTKARFTTHGMRDNPIYDVWNAVIQRCTRPSFIGFKDYGGRGITVCDKWLTFQGFFEDMGERPFNGATLERMDNDGPYCKDNCKWATRAEQNNHTRRSVQFTFKGEQLTLAQIAEKCGMNKNTLSTRIYKYGLSAEEAATLPIIPPEESGGMAGNPLFTEVRQRLDGIRPYFKED
jgi:hypothetical protein